MKSIFYQKSCQSLNKTTTIIDKLKQQKETMTSFPSQLQRKANSEQTNNDQITTTNAGAKIRESRRPYHKTIVYSWEPE